MLRRATLLGTLLLASVTHAATDLVARYLDNYPQQGELQAAEEAPVLTWTRELRGVQSVWVAEGERLTPRVLLSYPDDDGQLLGGLTLAPNGTWLAYVRGSSSNTSGEANNPLNLADPQERALWVVALSDGKPQRIAGGGSTPGNLAISPDSSTLAFSRGRDVWLAKPGAAIQPIRAFTIRGSIGGLAWSPDGQRLAFVNGRGAFSMIGVFDVATRQIRFLAPSIDKDASPVWSPDGRWLAFTRSSEPVQSYRFDQKADVVPWSLMIADTSTWQVATRWTADRGAGSAAYYKALLWSGNDELVFLWEKTGWSHIYRLSRTEGVPRAVTSGEGEVAAVTIARDGRTLYYHANTELRERYDLFSVPVAGGKPKELLAGYGVTAYFAPPALLDNGAVAVDAYTPREPGQIMLIGAQGKPRALVANATPSEFPAKELPEPEIVEVKAADGVVSRSLLYRPKKVGSGKVPALVYAHGGSRSIQTLRPNHLAGLVESLVMSGYAVIVPNFRSGLGYGLKFREAQGYGAAGGTDLADIVAAGEYLRALPEVASDRIGIFGLSYGGYLTTAALARAPKLFAAGVSIVGVTDWQMELELDAGGAPLPFRLTKRLELEELAYKSSAMADLSGWRAPILFIAGGDDQAGWIQEASQLGYLLRERQIPVESWVEPNGTHSPATHAMLRARADAALDFFERRLKQPKTTVTTP
ncbi:S9 family peptidase [Steroidobacter sp.]|uniref:S9 family peptidase n=1 Tax=Steroidobacter sp. TaxID=1978227 RepID=UPI001A5466A5|nr:prolyl oligopeptidase family serine peptidase [Steroidobacter sp.]MBL8265974.1 S9 family peptidase [Steroidobacter sp.]